MAKVIDRELFGSHTAPIIFSANDASEIIGARNIDKCSLAIQWPAGTTAGVFRLEASPNPDFAGTWVTLDTLTFATANSIQKGNIVDVQEVYLRVRCSTTVADAATKPRLWLRYEE